MNKISRASEAKALPATTFIGRLLIRSVINDVEISVLAAPVVQRRGFAAVDAIKALDGDLQLVASAPRERIRRVEEGVEEGTFKIATIVIANHVQAIVDPDKLAVLVDPVIVNATDHAKRDIAGARITPGAVKVFCRSNTDLDVARKIFGSLAQEA